MTMNCKVGFVALAGLTGLISGGVLAVDLVSAGLSEADRRAVFKAAGPASAFRWKAGMASDMCLTASSTKENAANHVARRSDGPGAVLRFLQRFGGATLLWRHAAWLKRVAPAQ